MSIYSVIFSLGFIKHRKRDERSHLPSRSSDKCGGAGSAAETHCDTLPAHPRSPSPIHGASDFQVRSPTITTKTDTTRLPRFIVLGSVFPPDKALLQAGCASLCVS